ncbi:MAG TPA: glycosyltransferase [Candidatus Saccharimonadales bacterium]|nr:glycosyltransferase [Candidatus Saccharimonadales bacterium]
MGSWSKDDVTVLLPCYNESELIADTVRFYKARGFSNVLVVDDGSVDQASHTAKGAGATVVRNVASNGFFLTTLRGLYHIKTKAVLIIDPDVAPNQESLDEFLEFGFLGNYGLLFSQGTTRRWRNVTTYLKKKFGVFVSDPNFSVAFINGETLSAVKAGHNMTEKYLYFHLIAYAIELKQKIGAYKIIYTSPYHGEPYYPSLISKLLGRTFRREDGYGQFFNYAFPDLEAKKAWQNFWVATAGAAVGAILTLIAQLILNWLGIKK